MKNIMSLLQYIMLIVVLISFNIDLQAITARKYTVAVTKKPPKQDLECTIQTTDPSCFPVDENFDIELGFQALPQSITNPIELGSISIDINIDDGTNPPISSNTTILTFDIYDSNDNIIQNNTSDLLLNPGEYAIAHNIVFLNIYIPNASLNDVADLKININFSNYDYSRMEEATLISIGCCEVSKNLHNIDDVGLYTHVENDLESNIDFQNNLSRDYIFMAGQSITLNPGFEAEPSYFASSPKNNQTTGILAGSILASIEICEEEQATKGYNNPYIQNTNLGFEAYPNPFQNNTQISFKLSEEALVLLEVYDITGRKLAILNEQKIFTKGKHQFTLEGSDLATGMYNVILDINGQKESIKIIKID